MLQKEIWRFAKKVSMLKTDEKRNTTISHLRYGSISFFCVLAPEGGESRRLLLARKMYYPKDYFLSLTNSKEKGHYHLIILTALRRQYQNKPRPSDLVPFIPPKTIEFIPSGANTQKIKRIDHCKYNVRASKNAEKAFSTQ